MMKRILLFLILTVLPLALYAQTSLEVSVSPAFNIASFITGKDSSISVDTSEDIAKGFAVSASILHEIYPWLSAGGTAYADTRSLIGKDGAFITIPFMAALRFSYPGEGIEIPLTIMAGGHAQIAGQYVKMGASFAISLGLAVKLTENFFLDISTWFTLLMQFSDDGRTAYQIAARPIALGVKAVF